MFLHLLARWEYSSFKSTDIIESDQNVNPKGDPPRLLYVVAPRTATQFSQRTIERRFPLLRELEKALAGKHNS